MGENHKENGKCVSSVSHFPDNDKRTLSKGLLSLCRDTFEIVLNCYFFCNDFKKNRTWLAHWHTAEEGQWAGSCVQGAPTLLAKSWRLSLAKISEHELLVEGCFPWKPFSGTIEVFEGKRAFFLSFSSIWLLKWASFMMMMTMMRATPNVTTIVSLGETQKCSIRLPFFTLSWVRVRAICNIGKIKMQHFLFTPLTLKRLPNPVVMHRALVQACRTDCRTYHFHRRQKTCNSKRMCMGLRNIIDCKCT